MKNLFKLILLLCIAINAKAQQIDFVKNMDEAVKIATKKKKPLFILIETPSDAHNQIAGLADPEVVELFNKNFVSIKLPFADTEAQALRKKYSTINKFPAFIFMHPDRELFFTDYGSAPVKFKYVNMVNNALNASTQKTLTVYEKEYLANKKDINALKAYIDARKKQGMNDNADLIEDYVNLLTISDFNNYQTVLYILEAGPYLDGNAYKFSRTNYKIVDSIYKHEPLEKRQAINANLKANTLNVAIKTKNIQKAQVVANFMRNTWGKNYVQGAQSYEYEIMNFYRSINDTAQYFRNAKNYYDRFYMTVSADSIKKIEERNKEEMLARAKRTTPDPKYKLTREQVDSLMKLPNSKITKRTETYATVTGMGSTYANQLNNAAYSFYELGTKDLNHLSKALIWSKRSITLSPQANYFDTLAHIYYAMGIYNEATATQKLAITKASEENQGDMKQRFEKELQKMLNKTL
ncbi:hypothetical protein VRU48_08875 [Pedobacter sp. KR3-3]|uniref:Thioredoxin domain-containing protein n=1 Tax=Pedobacter albus TaxID=3113905 RepID=A0ABU7I7K8_9SPHI|nr:hypothetical protein [Pedobacter sp. KR3-3]MEE1945219.1 hypothetical protein [Pedobacter sp. KR3-3]